MFIDPLAMASLLAFAALASVNFASAAPIPHARTLVARVFDEANMYANWPTYDQLPLHPSFPTKAAWGVWGDSDELGALNHITNTTILAAKSQITIGRAFNLNLELALPNPPLNPNRPALLHSIQPFAGYQDDILTLNTQISTQYDGLRHFPYSTDFKQETYQFYNDLLKFEDLFEPGGSSTLGIQNAAQKGIAGRGILLDWAGWMDSRNATYDAFSATSIPVEELDSVAKWQGLHPDSFTKPGDFLVVRTGFTKQYLALPLHEQSILPYREERDFIGVEASDKTLRWLWEKKLALVGSDNPAFESMPFNATIGGVPRSLHQVFIGGWGQSIVEFLNLENLAVACHQLKRYTFFFSLQNLNVVGGIASPPNAMAIM
ncbi:hypothetical protein C8J57DRAFT_1326368 [Mycena rebaudengoi]|nr:hypothetical protein C8J57DRAFT_1326368 [Mycena rebaudengoi]